VATTPTKILGFSPKRKAYRIYVSGAASIFIGPDVQVSTTNGYEIPTLTKESWRKIDGEETTLEVYAIVAAGTVAISVREELE